MLTLNLLIFLSLHFFEGLSVTLVHSLYPHSSVSSGIRPHCLCINKQRPSRPARNWINRWRESIKLTQIKPPTHLSCSMWVIPPPESLGPLGRPSPALQRQVEVAGNGSSASLSCPRGPQRGKRVNEKIFPAWDSGTQIDVYNPIGSCTEKDAFFPLWWSMSGIFFFLQNTHRFYSASVYVCRQTISILLNIAGMNIVAARIGFLKLLLCIIYPLTTIIHKINKLYVTVWWTICLEGRPIAYVRSNL